MNRKRAKSRLLPLARAAAKSAGDSIDSPARRIHVCRKLLFGEAIEGELGDFADALSCLPVDERHYWIGTFYTLLLCPEIRREQATYFTPPALAETVIDLAIDAGYDIDIHDVLDPAAGGAAFLSTLAARAARSGFDLVDSSYRLNGIEIDHGLASLSRDLIADRLGVKPRRGTIVSGDALRIKIPASYDLVIANPPYGRISEDEVIDLPWESVCHRGHINKYALFVELCLRHAKPGGIVALVIPSSFRAGPLFSRLREFIRGEGQVVSIGTIEQRNRLFVDVAQDVSVLIIRKGKPHDQSTPVAFHVIGTSSSSKVDAKLPADTKAPWPLPSSSDERQAGYTLEDWGIKVRSGYFVWNRQLDRLTENPKPNAAYPLIWAKNVRLDRLCRPAGKNGEGVDFVVFDNPSSAIITKPAAVLQRTTNDNQPRRIVSSVVDPFVCKRWGGFVTENHTISLTANCQDRIELLVKLLNTDEVDKRYRTVAGTAALSVTLLRDLDLPSPQAFSQALAECSGDAEKAAVIAYSKCVVGAS